MSFKTTGKILHILPEVTGTSPRGDWKKQDLVIETAEKQSPKKICFTLFNDKNDTFSKIKVGSDVEVSFSIESKEYQGRWFSNVNAFRVDVVQNSTGGQTNPPPFSSSDIPPVGDADDKDDLPF